MTEAARLLQDAITGTPAPVIAPTSPPVPDVKRENVQAASTEKREAMGAPQLTVGDAYRVAAGQATGAGRNTLTPVEQELATLTPEQIVQKYGPDEGNRLIRQQLAGWQAYNNDTRAQRSGADSLIDAVTGAGLGFANSIGGLGALAAGAVNHRAGVWASEQLQGMNDAVQGLQSDGLQARRRAGSAQNQLSFRDNAALFEENKKEYGSFLAGLRRIGRDAMDTLVNTGGDATLMSDLVANAAGSLAAGGPVSKMLSAGALAVVPLATQRGISVAAAGTPSLARAMAALGQRLPSSMTVGIGAMEAGGAYQGTAAEIARTPFEDLEKNSPDFRRMTQPVDQGGQGLSREEARTRLAGQAGLMAAAIAGPAGALAGSVTGASKLEAAPFRVANGRAALGAVAGETAEEGVQGVTGQLAQNLATQQTANENLPLSQGVGEQLALGALGGLGAASLTQAPGAAGRAVFGAGQVGANALINRADRILAENEARSPASDANLSAAAAAVSQAVATPEAETAIAEAIQQAKEAGATPQQQSAMENLASRIIGLARFTPEEIPTEGMSPEAERDLAASDNRVAALIRLAKEVEAKGVDTPEGEAAATQLYRQVAQFEALTLSDREAFAAIPDEHPAGKLVNTFNEVADLIQQNPNVTKALQKIQQKLAPKLNQELDNVTEADLISPKGQGIVQKAAMIAGIAPENGNLKATTMILDQAKQGKIQLTDAQFQALQTSWTLMSAVKKVDEEQARLGHTTPVADVSSQILENKFKGEKGEGGTDNSAKGFASRIYRYMMSGNLDSAASELENLGLFVQHMQNKVGALNAHFDQRARKNMPYQALNERTRKFYEDKSGLAVHPHSVTSVELAQTVALEAERLASIYNGLSEAFPELKGGKVSATPLNPALMGKPADVVKRFAKPAAKPAASTTGSSSTGSSSQAVSRITADQAKQLSDDGLHARLDMLRQKLAMREATPEDEATLDLLDAELERRESEAVVKEALTKSVSAAAITDAASTPPPAAKAGEGAEAEAKTEPKTVAEAFPKLLGSEDGPVKSWFQRAFRLPGTMKSRLLLLAKPFETLRSVLKTESKLAEFLGKPVSSLLGDKTIQGYQEYLKLVPKLREAMNAQLQKALNEKREKGKYAGKTWAEALKAGHPVNEFPELKALNLIEEQEDGSFGYNQQLLDMALIASLQWLLSADQFRSKMDQPLAQSLLSLNARIYVPQKTMDKLDVGLSRIEALHSMADMIQKFWGMSQNHDTPIGFTDGISQSFAGEVLRALVAENLVKEEHIPFSLDMGDPTNHTAVRFLPRQFSADSPLMAAPTLLEDSVLTEKTHPLYYEGDKIPVAPHQMRSTLIRNTMDQKKAITAAQKQGYKLNTKMHDLYTLFEEEGLQRLFGAGMTDKELRQRQQEGTLNTAHAESLVGKNRAVQAAFRALTSRVNYMKGMPKGLDTLIHYAFNMSSVGRLQMLGAQNPQSNKLVREAILPTQSTLDLREEGGNVSHIKYFTIAQAQALGVKVHVLNQEELFSQLDQLLNDKLADAVELLQHYDSKGSLPSGAVDTLKSVFEAIKLELTPVALHALLEEARRRNADEAGLQSFTTSLYVEADGVTNGVVNAMNLLSADSFSPEQIDNLARGGLSFVETVQTMNQFREKAGQKNDLYTDAAKNLQIHLNQLFDAYAADPEMQQQMLHLRTLMSLLLDGVNLVEKDGVPSIEVDRSVTKNPMTITLYGSGEAGIAGNLVDDMMTALYERMSKAALQLKADPKLKLSEVLFADKATDTETAQQKALAFRKAFDALIQNTAILDKKKNLQLIPSKLKAHSSWNPVSFQLDAMELKALEENLKNLFVREFTKAVEDTLGSNLIASTKMVIKATQVQSVVLKYAFKTLVNRAIAERKKTDPSFRESSFLSENELRDILLRLEKLAPVINTGSQVFYPSNSQTTQFKHISLAAALNEQFKLPAVIEGLDSAGVKGLPMMNIGMGDGMMIQVMLGQLGVEGLPVFDGFNMAIDKIEDGSVKANQAVFESWKGNPLKAIHTSFAQFQQHLPIKLLENNADLREELGKSLLAPWIPNTVENLVDAIQGLNKTLEHRSQEVEYRHEVIGEVQSWTDQMAAAGAPYVNKGEQLTGSSQDISDALNKRALAKWKSGKSTNTASTHARAAVAPAATTPLDESKSDKLKTLLGLGKATREGNRWGTRLSPTALAKLTSQLDLSPEQLKVWEQIRLSKSLKGYTILVGTEASFQDYQQHHGLPMRPTRDGQVKGYIDPENRMIYLVDPSVETLLHEMIHASTFATVLAYYRGQALDSAGEVGSAIQRLETLMDAFLKLGPDELTADQVEAFHDAQVAIHDYLEKGTPESKAAALNEYMAWSLANQQLIELHKAKASPTLKEMLKNAIRALKKLFFGLDDKMFSNLLFNTAIIIREQPKLSVQIQEGMLFQNSVYGNDTRLGDLNNRLNQIFGRFYNIEDKKERKLRRELALGPLLNVVELASLAAHNGFPMTMEANHAFRRITMALGLSLKLNPNALAQMDRLYRHMVQHLTPTMLMDPNSSDANEVSIAQKRFEMLMGYAGKKYDAEKRSSLLPVFMGLAMTNDLLRNALQQMPLPKDERNQDGDMDAMVTNAGIWTMETLADSLSGQGKAANIQGALDQLMNEMTKGALEDRELREKLISAPNTVVNWANDLFVDWLEGVTDKVIAGAKKVEQGTNSKLVKGVARLTNLVAAVATEKNAKLLSEGVLSAINSSSGWRTARELAVELIGRTDSNAPVFDLIKLARSMVQQVRQQFREHLPSAIQKQFTRRLTKQEWSMLFQSMGLTDLAALAQGFTNKEVLAMLGSSSKRKAAIKTLEAALDGLDPAPWSLVQQKAKQLANYMMTKNAGANLLRNTEAVARLLNEQTDPKRATPSQAYIQQLDQLISLYALETLNRDMETPLAELVRSQEKGMNFVLSYLIGQRTDENAKSQGMARFNAEKGYIPSLQQQGVSLIVAKDTDAPALLAKSYVRVADYKGSPLEGVRAKRGYYLAPVSARAAFSQGISQNVNQTAGGVDLLTGYSERATGGRIISPKVVARIAKQAYMDTATTENLVPVFDEYGVIVAYERSVDPVQLAALNADTHLAKMIGVWRGRQVEENIAQDFNMRLVDALHKVYRDDMSGDQHTKKEYVNLWDFKTYKDDPVLLDAVRLMSPEMRDYIKAVFGKQFMVRRDMLNDAFGYREASLGDAWTGNSRWDEKKLEVVKKLAMGVFGNDAYRILVNAESLMKTAVKDARTLIVVKSVVVPVANFTSNMFQLMVRGVPLSDIVSNLPRKLAEVNSYTKSRLRMIELGGQLRVAQANKQLAVEHRINAEKQAIEDSWKRLTIWPLIEAGEFSAISDAGISRDEILLSEGKLHGYVEQLVDRLPESVRNAGRYALITKDTALFQGLQKAVEYGDFLGKALHYDHLVKKRKQSSKQALAKVTEEFVHFDRLPGRTRAIYESLGLTWFFHFKLRSAKVAASIIRENPVQALLHSLMPMPNLPGSIGSPLSDNVFTKALEGTLGYSIGPGMLLRSPALHPVGNLLF